MTEFNGQLIKYFKLLIHCERKLDASRKVLDEEKGYNPLLCFRLIDIQNKGYASASDIQSFLCL